MRTLFDSHQNYRAEHRRVSALNCDFHRALRCVVIVAANIGEAGSLCPPNDFSKFR